MPNDAPADLLRLKRCPQCDYDLAALPRNHRCPECGFEYDEWMFMLEAWPTKETRPRAWERPAYAVLIVVCLGFWALNVARGATSWPFLAAAAVLAAAAANWVVRRRKQLRREGTVSVFASCDGIGSGPAGKLPKVRRWSRFRKVNCRRVKSGLWRIYVGWPWRQLQFSTAMVAYIECSDEEGKLLRERLDALAGHTSRLRPLRSAATSRPLSGGG